MSCCQSSVVAFDQAQTKLVYSSIAQDVQQIGETHFPGP